MKILKATTGHVLFDGDKCYGKILLLPDIDTRTFTEITEREYEAILEKEREESLVDGML